MQAARLKAAMAGIQFPSLSGVRIPAQAPSPARPSPSASYASYSSVAAGRASSLGPAVAPYLAMILDPLAKEKGCRYPDETIVPTGMVHLASSTSYTVPAGGTTFAAGLHWKALTSAQAGANPELQPIILPGPSPTEVGFLSYADYASPQKTWSDLSAVDRSLGLAIRLRLTGLPTSTFLPSGTLYFLQLQAREISTFFAAAYDEPACIQAVTAGKGFSATINELSKTDGVTLPFLPQGPMSFVFSDTGAPPAIAAGWEQPSGILSANGMILVIGFGLQAGMTLRVDYAHHIEYIPQATAAGLVQTKVEPPNSGARDAISRGAQAVQSTLAGATQLGPIKDLVTGGAMSALGSVARAAVSLIPGAAPVLSLARSAAEGLGAPQWLRTALGMLA